MPFMALLAYRDSSRGNIRHDCGGTLINKYYVMTAAHCLVNLPQNIRLDHVVIGEHNLKTNPDCADRNCAMPVQNIKVANTTIHKKYNRDKNGYAKGYDIALIRLEKPAKMFTVGENNSVVTGLLNVYITNLFSAIRMISTALLDRCVCP